MFCVAKQTGKGQIMRRYRKWSVIILLLLLVLGAGAALLISGSDFTAVTEAVITENRWRAVMVFMLFYTVKSMTAFFPLVVIQVAVGTVFPVGMGILVNLAGLIIIFTVPFYEGAAVGSGIEEILAEKYPWIGSLIKKQKDNSLFISFFLRVINFLPGDIITMYLGASGMPYICNLAGGIAGQLPYMVLATVMGESIRTPDSPAFIISITLSTVLSLVSILYIYLKKQNR